MPECLREQFRSYFLTNSTMILPISLSDHLVDMGEFVDGCLTQGMCCFSRRDLNIESSTTCKHCDTGFLNTSLHQPLPK